MILKVGISLSEPRITPCTQNRGLDSNVQSFSPEEMLSLRQALSNQSSKMPSYPTFGPLRANFPTLEIIILRRCKYCIGSRLKFYHMKITLVEEKKKKTQRRVIQAPADLLKKKEEELKTRKYSAEV